MFDNQSRVIPLSVADEFDVVEQIQYDFLPGATSFHLESPSLKMTLVLTLVLEGDFAKHTTTVNEIRQKRALFRRKMPQIDKLVEMTGFEPTTSWSRRKLDRMELSPDLDVFSTIQLALTLVLTLVAVKKSQLIEYCSLYQISGGFELNCSIFLVELICWF